MCFWGAFVCGLTLHDLTLLKTLNFRKNTHSFICQTINNLAKLQYSLYERVHKNGKGAAMPKIIENLLENLLAETRRELLDSGYESINIRTIAKNCHTAVGTVYNYFPSKDIFGSQRYAGGLAAGHGPRPGRYTGLRCFGAGGGRPLPRNEQGLLCAVFCRHHHHFYGRLFQSDLEAAVCPVRLRL